ncbi:MAG TPA: hypothetical protein VI819_00460 [Patescibacteria group bacterium]|nr:hypothetical protein [Patescibacteria group bacterium]
MNIFKNKTKDFFSLLKKQVKEESGEMVKHTSSQITGEDTHITDVNQPSEVAEAMQSDKPDLTDEEEVALQRKHIERVKANEDELAKYRKIREQLTEQRNQEFDKKMGKIIEPGAPMEKPFVVPKSKPSRRMGSGQKGSSVEMRKSKQ